MKNLFSDAKSKEFADRHIGINSKERKEMLSFLGFSEMDDFIQKVVPKGILQKKTEAKNHSTSEEEALSTLMSIAKKKCASSLLYWYGLL